MQFSLNQSKKKLQIKKTALKTLYYGTKLRLESSTHFLKVSNQSKTNGNCCPLSPFLITLHAFKNSKVELKQKIFLLIFCEGNSRCLFLLVEFFLVQVAEQSFFSIITFYKLILLKYTEEDLQHLQHLRWTSLLPMFNC